MLLVPTPLFLLVTLGMFYFAQLFSPHPARTESNIAALVEKANHGEFNSGADRLVSLVSSSWRFRDESQKEASQVYIIGGCALGAAIALQLYVILRTRTVISKRLSKQATG
jgi:hypothetical protein